MGESGVSTEASRSLPLWERGLKWKQPGGVLPGNHVAPLVGAWIEIALIYNSWSALLVAPLVGAWIEIPLGMPVFASAIGRSPCGSVD